MNEGLESLGENQWRPGFVFCATQLRRVSFQRGSKLETIGDQCFANSGLEEIWFPKTLREIKWDAFQNCGNLKRVWVEEGCAVDVRKHVPASVEVLVKSCQERESS